MEKRMKSIATFGTVLALGLAILPVELKSALAATTATEPEQVIVKAPYTIRRQVVQTYSPGRGAVERVTISRKVGYADLNLSNPSDVAELERRVKAAANDDCRQLDRQFSKTYIPQSEGANCVRNAARPALASVDAMSSRQPQRQAMAGTDEQAPLDR
jgi:UrcA family protein